MASTAALLWGEDDAAAAMGVTVADVRKLAASGDLPAVRLLGGPGLRFRPADVADVVDRLAEPVTTEAADAGADGNMNAYLRARGRTS